MACLFPFHFCKHHCTLSDLDDDDEFFDEDAESENKDEYEFDDIDPEIFRDPLLMVKWLNRHTQNQS